MRHKILSISKAKASLLAITRKVADEGCAYLLTKDGEPIGALVPLEDYEALIETGDILSDSQTFLDLKEALKDEAQGRVWERNSKGQWIKKNPSKKVP